MSHSEPLGSQLLTHIMEKYWQSSSKGPSGRHPTSSLTKRSLPAGNPGLSRGRVLGSGLCILCRRPLPLLATQQTGLKLPSTITAPFRFFPISQATHLSYTIDDIKPLEHRKSYRINPERADIDVCG